MKAVALGLVLLTAAGCAPRELNEVSVVRYERDDDTAVVIGKSLVNAVPWVVYGAVRIFFIAAETAPETVVSTVNGALP